MCPMRDEQDRRVKPAIARRSPPPWRCSRGGPKKRGLARLWPFLGPAFVACVAYIDPGNFATNLEGGAKFGYTLLWVVVASNLIGHAHPGPVGQAGHRHGQEPGRALPRALSARG